MAKDTGPIIRSTREALWKKMSPNPSTTPPNRKSERLEKRTPPSPEVRAKSENHNKRMKTPSPLRRSERSRKASSSSPPSVSTVHTATFEGSDRSEDEERDEEVSLKSKTKKKDARVYRGVFVRTKRDRESNRMDRSTKDGDDGDGDKIDEGEGNCLNSSKGETCIILLPKDAKGKEMKVEPTLREAVKEPLENDETVGSLVPSDATTHEISGALERVLSDSCREKILQVLRLRDSTLKENLIKKCVEHDKSEKATSCKRKRTMMDMHSDASPKLLDGDDNDCTLIEDARPSKICNNIVGPGGSCSKRIRQISSSDVQRYQMNLTNDVNLPSSSKYSDKKLFIGNKEEKSQGNNVESEIIREQQRSLHILLKPNIAKLCEILHLPDNVKRMVENCLEYTMNNYKICTEPASILQAFQLSLCCTASSLLKHKLDFEAFLMLAKQHLNFNCEKKVVDEINSRLWGLKENFLSLTAFSKAPDSSNEINSFTELTTEIEVVKKGNSKNIKNIQKHKTETQWDRLLLMQQEEKQKLEKDIEKETSDFERRCGIEWLSTIQSSYPNNVAQKEKHTIFHSEYVKKMEALKGLHGRRFKNLEAKHLEAKQKFQESSAPYECLNMAASKELGTRVESLWSHDQALHDNAPKALVSDNVSEAKSFNNIVEVEMNAGTSVGLSETTLVKNVETNEMAPLNSQSSEEHIPSVNTTNEMAPLNSQSSEEHIPSVNTTPVPNCENGAQTHEANDNSGSSNAEILSLPLSGEKNSLDSKSLHQPVHNIYVMSMPKCENYVQIHENDSNVSIDVVVLNSPLIDERNVDGTILLNEDETANFAPLSTDQISVGAHVSVLGSVLSRSCGAASPGNSFDANAINLLKQDSLEKQNHEVVSSTPGQIPVQVSETTEMDTLNVLDGEAAVGMPNTINCTDYPKNVTLNSSLMDQISDGGTVVDGALTSEPCASSPSNGHLPIDTNLNPPSLLQQTPDADLLPHLDEQILDRVEDADLLSHPDEQILDRVEVPGNSNEEVEHQLRESVTVDKSMTPYQELMSENSQEVAQCQLTDSTPLDKSTTSDPQQGFVLGKCHEEAHCQLTDSVRMDKNTSPDQQGGVCRNMTENRSSQVTPASEPVDVMEPLQVQPSVESPSGQNTDIEVQNTSVSVESPSGQDTVREVQNTSVSSPVNVPTNQFPHLSPVIEPPVKGQLPSAGFLSSNQDLSNLPLVIGTEDRPTNESDLSHHNSGTSIVIQSQDSSMQPALNMELHSLMCGGMRQESPEARNLSTPAQINNHPTQTAAPSACRTVSHLCRDPLKIELERLHRQTEQNVKSYENMKLQLKCDFEKELEKLCRKYDNKRQESDVEFQKLRKNLDTQYNIVLANKMLAETFRTNSMDLRVFDSSGVQQGASFEQQLFMLTRPQSPATSWPSLTATPSSSGSPARPQSPATSWPSLTATPSSSGSPAASFRGSYPTTITHTMTPPIPPRTMSNVSVKLPHVNSISPPTINLETGGEIRAPAPHLQSFRPPTSVPASNLCTAPHMRPSRLSPRNIPVTSAFSYGHSRPLRPQPMLATSQYDPHQAQQPVSSGGIPTLTLSPVNLRANANSQSGINSRVNPNSQSGINSHIQDLA